MMNKYNDYISVVMSTYNETELEICQSVESILGQTYSNFEFIIVLDNPDNKLICERIEQYAALDKRIRILYHQHNQGLTKSLNDGIRMAAGELIARMDADDVLKPNCFQIELEALHSGKLDFVAASKKNFDEHGTEMGTYINSFSPERMRRLLPYENSVNHPSVLMKKAVVDKLGGYREIVACEDYDLWIRMLCSGYRLEILPEVLLHYKNRSNSITRTNEYKRYLSERFVKKQYRVFKRKHRFMSMEYYGDFMTRCLENKNAELRFNRAYTYYCMAINEWKSKNILNALFFLLKSFFFNWRIVGVLLGKLSYHLRKKIVVRFW